MRETCRVETRALDLSTLPDIVCCPGGLELAGKTFLGDQSLVLRWHRDRIAEGMRGLVAYANGRSRGFAEFMPAEAAPFPIEGPGACVLLCFHWAGTEPEDPDHLEQEARLIEAVVAEARKSFSGLAALGWNHPTHYPIALLRQLGFQELARREPIALLWLPFLPGAEQPRLAPSTVTPRDLRAEGLLAIDSAWSARCPYSVSFAARLRHAIENHPGRDRISFAQHAIDTREDAFRLAVTPWDWGWTYLNGELINPFALPGASLTAEITRHVPQPASHARR
jgi:hypothetical protein